MQKNNYERMVLPYIEMYGGNTDVWDIPIYDSEGRQMTYAEAQYYSFTLVIKDYAYTHRPNGTTRFYLTKNGTVSQNNDGKASVVFEFSQEDTMSAYGKYIYQITSSGTVEDERNCAQGELFITKAIDQ